MVQSATSQTYTTGCLVYVGANGLATATGSNKVLGIYVGEGLATDRNLLATANDATLTEGVLIPVMTRSSNCLKLKKEKVEKWQTNPSEGY